MSAKPKRPDAKRWGRWPAVTFATLAAYLLSAGLIDGIRLTWTTNRLDAVAMVVYAPVYWADHWCETHCEPIHSAFDWQSEEWRLLFESCRSWIDDG
jgi:hypothetical protein